MKNKTDILQDLKCGDFIAFGFNYNGGESKEILVEAISQIHADEVLVFFNYGYKSLSEWVKKSEIIAIGNSKSGESKIEGYRGKFDILIHDHKLL